MDKEHDKFDKKNAKLLAAVKDAHTKLNKARTNYKNSRIRVATKHGFVRVRHG